MKKCPSCESELSPQARVCPRCGAQQPFETSTPLILPPSPPPLPPTEEEKEDEDESPAIGF